MRSSHRRGVTLVEVIVVIAIIVLAFLFLLMLVPRGREQARLASCTNNLRQIGIGPGDLRSTAPAAPGHRRRSRVSMSPAERGRRARSGRSWKPCNSPT